jgi:hypothetical protein
MRPLESRREKEREMNSRAHSGRQRSVGDRRRAPRSVEREADAVARELPRQDEREIADTSSVPEGSPPSRLDRISQRAYAIYQARGGEHGRSLDDWLEAERQIDAEQR